MLLEATLFFGLLAALTTLICLLPGAARARLWVSAPIGLGALAGAAWVIDRVGLTGVAVYAVIAFVAACAVRAWQPRWGWLAAQLFAAAVLGALAYLVYAAVLTYAGGLGFVGILASTLLLLLELAALALATSYLFEMLDVLGRRPEPPPIASGDRMPWVALQVPTYSEPVEIVSQTLHSLAALDYPHLLVQVVDNNTPDEATWRPLEQLCAELGSRFQFMHLENWPGYKAGALNEATRRLPQEIEIVGIVDADYEVQPQWLRETVGHFADPPVAFVQSPQDYRDWEDDGYLRGLYHSYKYFFDVTMPASRHRNAIIFAGTMGLIRLQVLRDIGGWNPDCVTEDAEASLRMLSAGHRGVYVNLPYGRGLMPLDFDGLRKQRFRWALGGIQILRLHAGDLFRGSGRLTLAQRVHYLLGSVQWFGEVLMALFTLLLLATAIATAMHHVLPVRQLTGAVLAIPIAFLFTGVLRALWAIRATSRCDWRDAFNALRVWFALSWIVTLACLRGLLSTKTAFLRTPKLKEGQAKLLRALWASRTETLLAMAAVLGAFAMVLRAPSPAVYALTALLLFQAFLYSNAAWSSLAAEGITMTPTRRAFLRSSQSRGEWPERAERWLAVPLAAAIFGAIILVLTALTAGPQLPQPSLPITGPPSPAPAASPSTAAPSPSPAPPSPASIPSPNQGPSTAPSGAPSP